MDLFDLKIVGWKYGMNMTDDLVIEAFNKALINRGLDKNAIFHSDRGSQYTSNEYEGLFGSLHIKHSYSKKGYPYDIASMESFNAILKKEEVNANNYETLLGSITNRGIGINLNTVELRNREKNV